MATRNREPNTLDPAFQPVIAAFAKDKGVAVKNLFARPGLSVGGKIFAFPWKGGMVLKLPAARVQALIAAGTAGVFDRGQGTPMKEWAAIAPGPPATWIALAKEARAFVGTAAAGNAPKAAKKRRMHAKSR